MLCSNCGTENSEQAEFCVHCCAKLSNEKAPATTNSASAATVDNQFKTRNDKNEMDESMEKENVTSHLKPRITDIDFQSRQSNDKPVVSSGLNIAIIIATVIFPIVGIAMGFTYLRKEHPDAKKAGKTWLWLGVVMFLVSIFMINLD